MRQKELPALVQRLAAPEVMAQLRVLRVRLLPMVQEEMVETVEALGADHLIHCAMLGQNVVFRVDNASFIPEAGGTCGMRFDAKAVHWFDPESTKRIRLAD